MSAWTRFAARRVFASHRRPVVNRQKTRLPVNWFLTTTPPALRPVSSMGRVHDQTLSPAPEEGRDSLSYVLDMLPMGTIVVRKNHGPVKSHRDLQSAVHGQIRDIVKGRVLDPPIAKRTRFRADKGAVCACHPQGFIGLYCHVHGPIDRQLCIGPGFAAIVGRLHGTLKTYHPAFLAVRFEIHGEIRTDSKIAGDTALLYLPAFTAVGGVQDGFELTDRPAFAAGFHRDVKKRDILELLR